VTFDLDLDLEHSLDARLPGDHRVQVWWRSGHLSARRSDLRKSLQTDRQTDGRTDDGRRAIALAHSWNELKMKTFKNSRGITNPRSRVSPQTRLKTRIDLNGTPMTEPPVIWVHKATRHKYESASP